LDRFSTDLDFDLLENKDIDDDILQIAKKYGKVKKWNKLILSYGENDINIKIDINRKLWKHNQYKTVDFYGTQIKVQDKATIFANKLVALMERNTNRDIYDVYFMFTHMFAIHEALIMERTWKSSKELFKHIAAKLRWLPKNYKILDWLGELLNEKQKAFVKEHLVKEIIWFLDLRTDFIR